ncbi:hypothetical protein CPB86DRAFT_473736 [Serendipita vermifera]|nr:hypothetical protein CPB86DRAFT_473736 [Serendipita vermifera]
MSPRGAIKRRTPGSPFEMGDFLSVEALESHSVSRFTSVRDPTESILIMTICEEHRTFMFFVYVSCALSLRWWAP